MKTLVITNSYDATTDMLISRLGGEKFVRINYDRPKDWIIKLDPENFEIKSNDAIIDANTYTLESIAKAIWRKPFMSEPEEFPYSDKFYKSEWKYLLFDLFSLLKDKGKMKLNYPTSDTEFGKIKQLRVAGKYFNVPTAVATINKRPNNTGRCICKSLSGTQFSDGKVLYTTDVTGVDLNEDFWYLQELVQSEKDVTIVYLYGKIHAFSLDRNKLKSLDWRSEPFEIINNWSIYKINNEIQSAICDFMADLGLVYGRLDFLERGKELFFLEVNKNGQWGWLDPKYDNGLFNDMLSICDPTVGA